MEICVEAKEGVVEALWGQQDRAQDRGGSVRWAGQGIPRRRCSLSRGLELGSGVISGVAIDLSKSKYYNKRGSFSNIYLVRVFLNGS